jgi:hypothetical protein
MLGVLQALNCRTLCVNLQFQSNLQENGFHCVEITFILEFGLGKRLQLEAASKVTAEILKFRMSWI